MKPTHIQEHTATIRAAINKLIIAKGFSPDAFFIRKNDTGKAYIIYALKGVGLNEQGRFNITLRTTTSREYKAMLGWGDKKIESGEVVGLPLAFINQFTAYLAAYNIIPRESLKYPYQEPVSEDTMYAAFPHSRIRKIDALLA